MIKSIKSLIVVVLISMLSTIVGCDNTNNNASNKEDTLEGEITILTDKKYAPQLELASSNFKKVHPKVQINIKEESMYNNLEQIQKEKNIDMLNIEDQYVQLYINKFPEFFVDVTNEINGYKNKISKSKIDNLTYNDKIYGYPWSTSPKVILYKKDVFEKEGINVEDIKTWSDYIDIGKKIKKDTNKKLIANIQEDNNDLYFMLSNQLNTSYFKDGKLDFSSKEWIKVLDVIKLLYSEGLVYDTKSYDDTTNVIKNGELVSVVADPAYINNIMLAFPNDKGKWGIIKFPAFEPGGNRDLSAGGPNLMISKKATSTSTAKEFAKFVLTDESTQIDNMKAHGGFPVFADIYNLAEFNNMVDYFDVRLWNILLSSETGSSKIQYTKYFPQIREILKNNLKEANIKDKDSKVILDSIQKACEEIVNSK